MSSLIPDKTLTIKTYKDSLQIEYTISKNTTPPGSQQQTEDTTPPNNIPLTGVIAEDTSKVENIFNTFLTGTSLKAEYAKFAPAQSLAKGVIFYRNFDDLSTALAALNDDTKVKAYNYAALNSALDFIDKRWVKTPLTKTKYFTTDALELKTPNDAKTTKAIAASVRAKLNEDYDITNNNPITSADYLKKYLNVDDWVTQFNVWLTEFLKSPQDFIDDKGKRFTDANNKIYDITGSSLFAPVKKAANLFKQKGGNKTQKNRKAYEE